MAKSLSARIAVSLAGVLENSLDMGRAEYPFTYSPNRAFTNGAGLNQASAVFSDTRTISASSNDDLDLNGTALQDALGSNIALTKLKAIVLVADAANTNDVVIGGASAPVPLFSDATDKLPIKPGGMFVWTAPTAGGVTVTATTADILRIANGGAGTPVSYTIFLIGA